MHQNMLSDNGTLGKIKEYVICYELWHCGSVHAHIILWVDDNDLEKVMNEIITFILTIFDDFFKIVPPNHSLQLKMIFNVLTKTTSWMWKLLY